MSEDAPGTSRTETPTRQRDLHATSEAVGPGPQGWPEAGRGDGGEDCPQWATPPPARLDHDPPLGSKR